MKFHDVNQNGTQDPSEPGLIGWTIHVFDTATKALVQSVVTVAANPGNVPPTPDGFYSFNLSPGSYTVCEELQTGWQQTAPIGPCRPRSGRRWPTAPRSARPTGSRWGRRGYSFTIVGAEVFANNDFGNFQPGGHLSEVPEPGPDQYVHAQCGPEPDPEDHRRRGDR